LINFQAERLKNYVTFSTKYKAALTELQHQAETSSVSKFLEAKQQEDPHNLRLADYLIKPIQRLCKYPLIFRELLKSTPEDHKDRNFMKETMASLEALTTHVNECNQAAEDQEALLMIEETISGIDCRVATPGRRLLKDGTVWISTEKERSKARRLLVLNDLVIIAKPKTKKMHQCVRTIESSSLLFVPIMVPTEPTASPKTPDRKGSRILKKRTQSGSLVSRFT